MVDRLRSSLEHLEAPACPRCRAEMRWFESRLVEREPALIVEHHFVCSTCGGFSERRNTADPNRSSPATRLGCQRDLMARAA